MPQLLGRSTGVENGLLVVFRVRIVRCRQWRDERGFERGMVEIFFEGGGGV